MKKARSDVSITVAQLGARMHYAVPEILVRNGMLSAFHTDIFNSERGLARMVAMFTKSRTAKRFLGRVVSSELKAVTRQHVLLGIWYMFRLRQAKTLPARQCVFIAQARAFGRAVARTDFDGADAVYAFTSASLEMLEHARALGVTGVLEQFIAAQPFLDRLLVEERERYPYWESGSEVISEDTGYHERIRREWELADTIICPSQFVADSLEAEGVAPGKLAVVPYGVSVPEGAPSPERPRGGPLRVLFVGTVELRKGVHYLAEALGGLDPRLFEARFAGPVRLSSEGIARLGAVGNVLGQVPRSEVGKQFDWADVLVLPSLVEGSATVTYEALVRGIPVVCTPNAGSIVEHERTGLLVPPHSADELGAALGRLAEAPDFLAQLQETAFAERHKAGLVTYENNLLAALRSRLNMMSIPVVKPAS